MAGGVELEGPHEAGRQFPGHGDLPEAGPVCQRLRRRRAPPACAEPRKPCTVGEARTRRPRKHRACLTARCGRCLQLAAACARRIEPRRLDQIPSCAPSRLAPARRRGRARRLRRRRHPARQPPASARSRTLPPPHKTLLPTVHVAPAKGWADGDKPVAAAGLAVTAYATGLDHPRWLTVLPNGDVLVAETNAPPKPEDGKGVKGWVMKQLMKRAGAGTPSADRITLLRGVNGDGSGRVAQRLPRAPALAVRHGAGRQRLLRRQLRRRSCASPTSRARPASTPRRRPSRRCRPGRSTTTGPRT